MRVGYKMSDLGEIPENWNVAKLETVTSKIGDGLHSTPRYVDKSDYYFVNGNNLVRGKIVVSERTKCISEEEYYKHFRKLCLDTLLLSINGTIGNVAYYQGEKVILGKSAAYISCTKKIDVNFLFYLLQSEVISRFYRDELTGSTISNLSLKSIRNTPVPLPNIEEQKKIATILSTVDEKIEVIEEQIKETETLKKGLMQQLLTKGIGHTKFKDSPLGEIPENWEFCRLGQLVEKVGSGITPKGGNESYLQEGILFIRSQNVLRGKLKLSEVAYISKEQHDIMKGSKIRCGDVLLNITGASIGRAAVVPEIIVEGNVNQHVCIIRTLESLNNDFLCHYLNSSHGQNQIVKFQAGGNREGLNFQQIRSFDIPFPTQSEQTRISIIINTVIEKLESLQSRKENFQELKKGLMQQLLTGKMRIKI